jgi:hypothetical protein
MGDGAHAEEKWRGAHGLRDCRGASCTKSWFSRSFRLYLPSFGLAVLFWIRIEDSVDSRQCANDE